MAKFWCILLITVALALAHTTSRARNVPEDPTLSDQKNFILGGFAGNGGGDPTNSGMGVFGGFDSGSGFGGFGGPGTGSGIFPGIGGSGGSTGDDGHFGSFPLP